MATVLVIGDTHCPAMRKGYVRFLQEMAERWQPDRIVHIGDLIDWHSISYHERLPSCSSPKEEYRRAKRQVYDLWEAFPKADWLIGNHDALTQRQAASVGLPPEVLKDYGELWELPGWKIHDRYGEVMIDGVAYIHGEGPHGPGQTAAVNRAKVRFRSVVMGHWHAEGGVNWFVNDEFRVFGLSVGTGIDRNELQLSYGKPQPKKPMLGCGIVEDGVRAYFEPWCLKSR